MKSQLFRVCVFVCVCVCVSYTCNPMPVPSTLPPLVCCVAFRSNGVSMRSWSRNWTKGLGFLPYDQPFGRLREDLTNIARRLNGGFRCRCAVYRTVWRRRIALSPTVGRSRSATTASGVATGSWRAASSCECCRSAQVSDVHCGVGL